MTGIKIPAAFDGDKNFDNNTLFIDASTDRVGIGTVAPSVELHTQGDQPDIRLTSTNTLEASGGTEKIASIEGEANKNGLYRVAAKIQFRQDGTWSAATANNAPTAISFHTQDNSASDALGTERMVINSSGNVGIGTSSPGSLLHILKNENNVSPKIRIENVDAGSNAASMLEIKANGGTAFIYKNSTTRTADGGVDTFNIANESGGVYLSPGATSWSAISDMRYKTKVADFTGALNKLQGLSAFTYTLNADEEKHEHLGLSAQEVVERIPEVITGDPATKMGIQYDRLVPVLIQAIQELTAKVEALETK